MKNLWKPIFFFINKIQPFFLVAQHEYRRHAIGIQKDIHIGKNVFISDDAKIETRYGGGIRIGNNCHIFDGVLLFSYGGNITIGDWCNINPYTVIYGHGNTTIGNNVLIAGHCMIIPNNHMYSNPHVNIMEQGNTSKGIFIEDDVWIAHGCSILDGVTIGKGSVIAAGSVVNTSVPPYSVYGGIPAKFIKKRLLRSKRTQHELI